jgi:hypothetical protein
VLRELLTKEVTVGAKIPTGYVEMLRIKILPEEQSRMTKLYAAAQAAQSALQEYAASLGNKYVHAACAEDVIKWDR